MPYLLRHSYIVAQFFYFCYTFRIVVHKILYLTTIYMCLYSAYCTIEYDYIIAWVEKVHEVDNKRAIVGQMIDN